MELSMKCPIDIEVRVSLYDRPWFSHDTAWDENSETLYSSIISNWKVIQCFASMG
jgi:hypothetical protein